MALGGYPSPQQQAWEQAIQQQQALYRRQTQQLMAAQNYHTPLPDVSQIGGIAPYSNPLFGQTNPISSTGLSLYRPTDPQAGNLALQYALQNAGQAGDTGISSNPLLLAQLSGGRF